MQAGVRPLVAVSPSYIGGTADETRRQARLQQRLTEEPTAIDFVYHSAYHLVGGFRWCEWTPADTLDAQIMTRRGARD
jgi:hypothetical protein